MLLSLNLLCHIVVWEKGHLHGFHSESVGRGLDSMRTETRKVEPILPASFMSFALLAKWTLLNRDLMKVNS